MHFVKKEINYAQHATDTEMNSNKYSIRKTEIIKITLDYFSMLLNTKYVLMQAKTINLL